MNGANERTGSTVNRRFFRIEALNLFKAVLLPLLILGLAVGITNNRMMNREIDGHYQSKIDYISERMNSLTIDIERLTYSLTTNPAVTVRLKSAMQNAGEGGIKSEEYAVYNAVMDLIFATCSRNPYIESFYIYFEAGGESFISNEKRLTTLSEHEDTAWYELYLQQDPFVNKWSRVRTIEREGKTKDVLTVFSRIFAGGNGSDRGVLVLNLDRAEINALLDTLGDSRDVSICIADEEENVIFSNEVFCKTYGDSLPGFFPEFQSEDPSFFDIRHDSVFYTCSDREMSSYGWHLLSFISVSDLYRSSRQITGSMVLILLIVMMFGIVFAYRMAKQNSRDVMKLEHSFKLAREGVFPGAGKASYSPYGAALMDLMDTFLDKEYRKVRSADRRHHIKLLELQALQAQLNPHFLFNTMTTIQWKAIALTGGSNAASEMLENLSDILHYVLDNGVAPARLDEELMITDSYVSIQKIRYAGEFEYAVHCDEHLYDRRVMRMLLQPLVENSISHGMRGNGETLHVDVEISCPEDMLLICVRDDGQGMDKERLAQVREGLKGAKTKNGKHIGLYNVNKRVELTYGAEYGVDIDSREGEGTCIRIRLPLDSTAPDEAV